MKKLLLFLLLTFLINNHLRAQFGNVWLFERGLKMNFNNDTMIFTPPWFSGVVLEANAVICDSSGTLLYYSNGYAVKDTNLIELPNGDSLGGSQQSHQGALFIPHPGNPDLIYLFTVDCQLPFQTAGMGGLTYAIIDKTLNAGAGDVISKRNLMLAPVKEKLTATRHCNGVDWWIVTHEWNSDAFYSWKLTPNGLDTIPVISHVGVVHQDTVDTILSPASRGDLKISPNGKLIVAQMLRGYYFELLNYNNETGQVFDKIYSQYFPPDSSGPIKAPFSCTFSKTSKTLYMTWSYTVELVRYDLSVLDSTAIENSIYSFFEDSIAFNGNGAVQLGPDGRIYFTTLNSLTGGPGYLDKIVYPDLPYPDCNISYMETYLNPTGFAIAGISHMPNFPDCIFARQHSATLHIPTCTGADSAIVVFDTLLNVVHDISWDFGDPASGTNNTYEGTDPFHLFSAPGTYTITLTFTNRCNQFVISRDVFIPNTTPPVVPTLVLNAAFLEASVSPNYQWYLNDSVIVGANDFAFAPNQNGIYKVSTTQNGCTVFSLPFQLTAVALERLRMFDSFFCIQADEHITLQCNPVNDCFQTIELIDLQGRILQGYHYQQKISKVEINLQDLQSGVYLLRVNGRDVRKVLKD
jgi:hypothetical protein